LASNSRALTMMKQTFSGETVKAGRGAAAPTSWTWRGMCRPHLPLQGNARNHWLAEASLIEINELPDLVVDLRQVKVGWLPIR
jgi:hypothetical protein